jgi:hypothetical protein
VVVGVSRNISARSNMEPIRLAKFISVNDEPIRGGEELAVAVG